MGEEASSEARDTLFSQVSTIRGTAQLLLDDLATLRKVAVEVAQEPSASSPGRARLLAAVDQYKTGLDAKRLEERRTGLDKQLAGTHRLRKFSENSSKVADYLQAFCNNWPAKMKPQPGPVLVAIDDGSAILDKVVFHCSLVTVPDEVKDELSSLRVGKPLDFEDAFKEKLPDAQRRRRILSNLKHQQIDGWVDVGKGLIYRLPRSSTAQVVTCIAPFVVALLAAGLMYAVPSFGLPSDWHLEDKWGLVAIYLLVLLGVVLHLIVENLKQMQTQSVPIVAFSDGVYWLNLHWLGLVWTVVLTLVVAIALRVAGVESNSEGIPLYVAAGYSVDSVAGLVLTRFDSAAGTWLRKVNEQIEPPKQPAPKGAAKAATSG